MTFKKNELCIDAYNNIAVVLEDEIELYYDNEVDIFRNHEFVEVFVLGESTIVCIYDLYKIEEGDFL